MTPWERIHDPERLRRRFWKWAVANALVTPSWKFEGVVSRRKANELELHCIDPRNLQYDKKTGWISGVFQVQRFSFEGMDEESRRARRYFLSKTRWGFEFGRRTAVTRKYAAAVLVELRILKRLDRELRRVEDRNLGWATYVGPIPREFKEYFHTLTTLEDLHSFYLSILHDLLFRQITILQKLISKKNIPCPNQH